MQLSFRHLMELCRQKFRLESLIELTLTSKLKLQTLALGLMNRILRTYLNHTLKQLTK